MISIVLPCYNPPPDWDQNLLEQYHLLTVQLDKQPEIIVVNDGSSIHVSATQTDLLKRSVPLFSYVSYEVNRGKGFAIREGMKQAKGDIVLYTDIDLPYTLESIIEIIRSLEQGSDVAIGIKDDHYYSQVPPARRFISRSLRKLIGIFFRLPVTDTQCGLKGFRRKMLPVFLSGKINRYLFDLEFIRNCYRQKEQVKIKAIPVRLKESVVFRKMNYRILIPELFDFVKLSFKK